MLSLPADILDAENQLANNKLKIFLKLKKSLKWTWIVNRHEKGCRDRHS
jgi:hypothetical protein